MVYFEAQRLVDIVLRYGAHAQPVYGRIIRRWIDAVRQEYEYDARSRIGPGTGAGKALVAKCITTHTVARRPCIILIGRRLIEAQTAAADGSVVGSELLYRFRLEVALPFIGAFV